MNKDFETKTSGENNTEPESNKKTVYDEIFDWIRSAAVALICVLFIFSFCFRWVVISGESMENTLLDGERVIVSGLFYEPKCGDIVIISRNYTNDKAFEMEENGLIIKRVIATGGQTVDIDFDRGVVLVDGKELDEPYTKTPTYVSGGTQFPLEVPDGKVFVLGDNRRESLDSRYPVIGLIDERYILGKALFRVFPLSKFGDLYE